MRDGAHQVRDAEEVRDEHGLRFVVDLLRRAGLLDPAPVHDREAVAHRERLLLVVGHVDEGEPDLLLKRLELDLERPPDLRVERSERLIEQHHGRSEHEHPRERDPLLLSTGQLRRFAALQSGELDLREDVGDAAADLAAVDAGTAQPERDVVEHAQVREQCVALEHGVDVAPVRGDPRDVDPVEEDLTAGRWLEARDHAKRRRLSAARRPEQREELARRHAQADRVDGDRIVVSLGEIDERHLAAVRLLDPHVALAPRSRVHSCNEGGV